MSRSSPPRRGSESGKRGKRKGETPGGNNGEAKGKEQKGCLFGLGPSSWVFLVSFIWKGVLLVLLVLLAFFFLDIFGGKVSLRS